MSVDYGQLAVTGTVPTTSEYNNIQKGTEGQRRELTYLNEAIKNQLSHLNPWGIESCHSCNSSAGLMSPIRKVPSEILGDIFILSLPSISWQEVENENHWFFRQGDDPYKTHYIIQSTCRHWSAILADTPGVWSTIMICNPPLTIVQIEKNHPPV
ncbi:hypothetical protein K439DRAFT_168530 [Ramaria rubella]|nr:hypothetical protein K439DRAFT_168530 [Ramaria rubella]